MATLTAVSGDTAGGIFRTVTLRFWLLRIVCLVSPSVGVGSLGVTMQFKDFDYPIPNHPPIKFLFHRYALDVGRVDAVKAMDDGLQFLDIGHSFSLPWAISNRVVKGHFSPSVGGVNLGSCVAIFARYFIDPAN